jgi:hypothetical protein
MGTGACTHARWPSLGQAKVLNAAGSPALADAASSVANYDVVLLVSPSLALLQRWDEACRQQSIAFFGAASRGACSFFFVDLQAHTFSSTVCVVQEQLEASSSSPWRFCT